MLVAPLWEESVNVQTCLGINTQIQSNPKICHCRGGGGEGGGRISLAKPTTWASALHSKQTQREHRSLRGLVEFQHP